MTLKATTRAELVASVTVRQIAAMDSAGLERFYAELSDDSRAMRFLGATRPLDPARSQAFCTLDHEHREGFVAMIHDPDLGADAGWTPALRAERPLPAPLVALVVPVLAGADRLPL